MNAAKRSIATTDHNNNAGRKIAVIGGGLGGLTAALAFARQGAEVSVYEQAAALTEVGAGIQITPNGARALDALGLADALSAKGLRAQAVMPMDGLSGATIARFDLTAQVPAYRFFHRAALIGILADACVAAGVKVHLNSRVTDYRPDGGFDVAGRTVKPDLTIGADGVQSVLRGRLNGAAQPFFTGQVAWRAIIDQPDAPPEARIWMFPGRHIVTYPLSEGRLNIVAVQERDQWADEGWHHADDPAHLRSAFADCCDPLGAILAKVDTVGLWGLFRHPVALNWYQGTCAILGDAAHPTLPFLAQGANLAVEDAYQLARATDAAADLGAGLAAYQAARKGRVTRAINAANANARNYHLGGVRRIVAHGGLRLIGRAAPGAFLGRLGWLYDFDVTA
ncbi:FAD-dependent monooxygenase [Yoonia sp. SS1-5]|uniref:FAD-dependent monooxygenase n=1 Tax=Yoonia rhodophyticola TaxID=3137370 RepID=A0AAN0MDX0_9RHOB